MDAARRETLSAHLRERLDALAREIDALVPLTSPVAPDPAIGRLSRLEAIGEKSVHEAALRSARARQARIRAQLARIDDDDFGLCARCEDPIPFERLLSVPGATLCVACAQDAER